jgi:integrase/recombinase XerD
MSVNITKRVKLDKGWYFAPVTPNAKRVIIDGQELDLPGRYYIDFRLNGRRTRLAAGETAKEAWAKKEEKEKILAAHKAAAEAGITLPAKVEAAVVPTPVGRPLRATVEDYLTETQTHKKTTTYNAYRKALQYFLESCKKATVEEITREDMLAFRTHLKRKGHSDRTIHNQFGHVMIFLVWCGVTIDLKKQDRPVYTDEEVEIYTQAELDKFFAACSPMEKLWFTFFLETGMRDQEVMLADWSWVNSERNVITVRENKRFDWRPKMNKGRQIAVPSSLIASLKEWKRKCDPACGLIFPNTHCRPKGDFLAVCKDIAKRANLNPDEFFLHKFRATRITNWLRDGLDLKSVQKLAGHANTPGGLAATSRYLSGQEMDNIQARVEAAANRRK